MNLLEALRRDHRRLRLALRRLARAAGDRTVAIRLAAALRAHFQREEELLFGELERRLPEARAVFAELRAQHRELEQLAGAAAERESQAPAEVNRLAGALDRHLREEEAVLFAFASRLLDGERLQALGDAFHRPGLG